MHPDSQTRSAHCSLNDVRANSSGQDVDDFLAKWVMSFQRIAPAGYVQFPAWACARRAASIKASAARLARIDSSRLVGVSV